jgi:SAM-dependent methyltransferase
VSEVYDAIAAGYDRQLDNDAWMRRILWKRYLAAFRAGEHVLDVGCGTGTDAIFLAEHGIRVTAIDVSPAMVAEAEQKVARTGMGNRVHLVVMDIKELCTLPAESFDGVISAFAVLNTLPSLAPFGADTARLQRPAGRMLLHMLSVASLRERAGLLVHGRWAEARELERERVRTFTLGGQPVRHYLLRGREAYDRNFAPQYRLCRASGLGILRPPQRVGRLPATVLRALARADETVGSFGPLIDWGSFYLLELERRAASNATGGT